MKTIAFLFVFSCLTLSGLAQTDFCVYKTYADYKKGHCHKLGEYKAQMIENGDWNYDYKDAEGKSQKYKLTEHKDWGGKADGKTVVFIENAPYTVLEQGTYVYYGKGMVTANKMDNTYDLSASDGFYFSKGLGGTLIKANYDNLVKEFPTMSEATKEKIRKDEMSILDFLTTYNKKRK